MTRPAPVQKNSSYFFMIILDDENPVQRLRCLSAALAHRQSAIKLPARNRHINKRRCNGTDRYDLFSSTELLATRTYNSGASVAYNSLRWVRHLRSLYYDRGPRCPIHLGRGSPLHWNRSLGFQTHQRTQLRWPLLEISGTYCRVFS